MLENLKFLIPMDFFKVTLSVSVFRCFRIKSDDCDQRVADSLSVSSPEPPRPREPAFIQNIESAPGRQNPEQDSTWIAQSGLSSGSLSSSQNQHSSPSESASTVANSLILQLIVQTPERSQSSNLIPV